MRNKGAKSCRKCRNIYPTSAETCPHCFEDNDSVQTEEYEQDEVEGTSGLPLPPKAREVLDKIGKIIYDAGAQDKDAWMEAMKGQVGKHMKNWDDHKDTFDNVYASVSGERIPRLSITKDGDSWQVKKGGKVVETFADANEAVNYVSNNGPHQDKVQTGNKLSLINRLYEKKTRLCRLLTPSVTGRYFAVLVLFLALSGEHEEDDYYTLVRFVICAVCVYSAHIAFGLKKTLWLWTFGLIAAFYNPFIPLHLEQGMWSFLDVITGILLLTSIRYIREV